LKKIELLQLLADKVVNCQRCPELLCRNNTVFGDGNPGSRVVFIGEAPGENEDKTGIPFVGAAGNLLNQMIAACGWRREDVYIMNVLKCRPPGNRPPKPEEVENCRPFFDLQLNIIRPKYIVCLGGSAAQRLGFEAPISDLRGEVFHYNGSKVICTYHPSHLLSNPHKKKLAAEDLKLLLRTIDKDQNE
jgi:uracil-DNA glycosylase